MKSFCNKDLSSTLVRLIITLLVITAPFIFYACYPADPISPADTDVVATFYKKEANFAAAQTFAMPDSVVQIGDGEEVSGEFDQQILDRIKQNLLTLGYTEEVDPQDADVHVVPFKTNTTWVSGGCYWYWGWWYPYPGYCYPVAYTYTTGSIVIAMTDPDNTIVENALWTAAINGLITGSGGTDISNRIDNNIDQAFTQSPYLGEGK
jgi:hypothetical protein